MTIPVIIAAHNEAAHIGNLLDRLPATDLDPIVVANGCNDTTAEIARGFGATTLLLEDKGKMPAIQEGLKHLGCRALEPILFLDADSFPISSRWQHHLLKALPATSQAGIATGPLVFMGGNSFPGNICRSLRRQIKTVRAHRYGGTLTTGANLGIKLSAQSLDDILALDNYWPGEDRAIRDVVLSNGGVATQVLNPLATVVTDSPRSGTLRDRFTCGQVDTRRQFFLSYLADAPPDSIPYEIEEWLGKQTPAATTKD